MGAVKQALIEVDDLVCASLNQGRTLNQTIRDLRTEFNKKGRDNPYLLDYATSTLPNGKKLHALSAGCYLNHKEHFARDTQHMWWSGIIIKREVVNGSYNMETIDYNAIRREYGRL